MGINAGAMPTFIYPDLVCKLRFSRKAGIAKLSYDWTYAQMEAIASNNNASTNEYG